MKYLYQKLYMIFLTDSRTCMIVSIVVIIYFFFGRNVKLPKWIVSIVMLIPLVFLLVYSGMYERGLYMDAEILGKELYSGREEFFIMHLERLMNNLAFGDVREYHFTNLHNGALAVLSSCGVIGYIFYFLFYRNRIQKYFRIAQNSIQYIALIVILGAFVHSCTEAALIVGGAHYSIIVATFFWILKGNLI